MHKCSGHHVMCLLFANNNKTTKFLQNMNTVQSVIRHFSKSLFCCKRFVAVLVIRQFLDKTVREYLSKNTDNWLAIHYSWNTARVHTSSTLLFCLILAIDFLFLSFLRNNFCQIERRIMNNVLLMAVGCSLVDFAKYGLAALIRIASSPFGVFQENECNTIT